MNMNEPPSLLRNDIMKGGNHWLKVDARIGLQPWQGLAPSALPASPGGSIPRAELCRFDGAPRWTSLKRFYSPEGWRPWACKWRA